MDVLQQDRRGLLEAAWLGSACDAVVGCRKGEGDVRLRRRPHARTAARKQASGEAGENSSRSSNQLVLAPWPAMPGRAWV